MLKRILYSFCVCALLTGVVSAAPAYPATQENIDTITLISRELFNMVDHNSDLLVDEGLIWLNAFAVVLLVWHGVTGMLGSFESMIHQVFKVLLMFVIYRTMLVNYNTPLPLSDGQSFHQLFFQEARWIAGKFDLNTVSDVIQVLKDLQRNLPTPKLTDGLALIILPVIWCAICAATGLVQYTTLIAYIALGLGGLLGPILIPFGMVRSMHWLFNGWIRFMCGSALFLICASAMVNLFAHTLLWTLSGLVRGDFSVSHMVVVAVPFIGLISAFVFALFQTQSWARSITHGTVNAGDGLAMAAQRTVSYVLSR